MAEPLHAKLRRALFEVFSDGELNDFAFDYFPQVYNNFTGGMDNWRRRTLSYYWQRAKRMLKWTLLE
jgi:hypothetical protein